uniref:Uncharacterized protein n=1 Tax=Peronospora matthiolae TaxID=2874970 RepID=A0AAV1VM53_9STRA
MLDIFGSSCCSNESSPHASPSDDRTRGDGGAAPMHHHERSNSRYRGNAGASAHAGINQEARDRIVLRHAPQVEFPWVPPSRELDRLTGTTVQHRPVNRSNLRTGSNLVVRLQEILPT